MTLNTLLVWFITFCAILTTISVIASLYIHQFCGAALLGIPAAFLWWGAISLTDIGGTVNTVLMRLWVKTKTFILKYLK